MFSNLIFRTNKRFQDKFLLGIALPDAKRDYCFQDSYFPSVLETIPRISYLAIINDFRGGLYARIPSPEALDAVYRRPCSCASIRHHARSSFANSGKFTKFKCKIGRCAPPVRWRRERDGGGTVHAGRTERNGERERRMEDTRDRKTDICIEAKSERVSEKGWPGLRRGNALGERRRESGDSTENGVQR